MTVQRLFQLNLVATGTAVIDEEIAYMSQSGPISNLSPLV